VPEHSPGAQPVPRAPNAPPPDGSGFALQAVQSIFFGETDWEGGVSATQDDWQRYGFNVDGLHFTDGSQALFHCKLQTGGDPNAEVLDGDGGVDNSFGKNALPILEAFDTAPSAHLTSAIGQGQWGMVLQLAKLGAGADYDGIVAQAFFDARGSDAMGMPFGPSVAPTPSQWADGSYAWLPYSEGLVDSTVTDPSLYQSNVQFPASYLSGNHWVSGARTSVVVPFLLGAGWTMLLVHEAVIELPLSADHVSGDEGRISGVLTTSELQADVMSAATQISTSYCQGETIDAVLAAIAAASDIGKDGTQDPTKACDGISIGIGLMTRHASLGLASTGEPPVNHCAGSGG
jgi:hypothetical protein